MLNCTKRPQSPFGYIQQALFPHSLPIMNLPTTTYQYSCLMCCLYKYTRQASNKDGGRSCYLKCCQNDSPQAHIQPTKPSHQVTITLIHNILNVCDRHNYKYRSWLGPGDNSDASYGDALLRLQMEHARERGTIFICTRDRMEWYCRCRWLPSATGRGRQGSGHCLRHLVAPDHRTTPDSQLGIAGILATLASRGSVLHRWWSAEELVSTFSSSHSI